MNDADAEPSQRRDPFASRSFWDLLRNSGRVFESTVKGTSMQPTIPDGARVRIRPQPAESYRVGQIVACVLKDDIFAHRIVLCGSTGRSREAVVTQGDALVLCDPPTKRSEILGEVTEYWTDGAWRVPAPARTLVPRHRIVALLQKNLIRMCLPVHYEFARRVAGTTLIVGSACGRVLAAIRRE